MENPTEVNKVLLEFLTDLDGRSRRVG